jgi:hypothetical protein
MYDVDARDRVVPFERLPKCDVGAPMPALVAAEHRLELAYIGRPTPGRDEVIVVATFDRPYAHMFGAPSEDEIENHPLTGRGLEPFGAFRIEGSSWIRRLERMNAVPDSSHSPVDFSEYNHFVLTFHDSTFECVATEVEVEIRPTDEPLTLSVQIVA